MLLLTLGVGALTGCSDDETAPAAAPSPSPSVRVLQPGAPGEPVEVVTDPTPAAPPAHTEADVVFARDMVVHHAQAIEMAGLAPQRAASPKVTLLAERIVAAQGPEIAFLGQWLADREVLDAGTAQVVAATTDRALPASDGDHVASGSGHGAGHGSGTTVGGSHGAGHAGMPGMATAADLAALRDTRGVAFDRLFLQLMVRHHQGALTMVDAVTAGGRDLLIEELAADVGATQAVEIDRMQELLRAA